MASATTFSTDSINIKNRNGRGSWFVVNDTGELVLSEINPDPTHIPSLLKDPIAEGVDLVTGVAHSLTFQFDGILGPASTVSVVGSGNVSSATVSKSNLHLSYTPNSGDVLRFIVKSADGQRVSRRHFTPATVTLGPSYVLNTLTPALFTDGWPISAALSFDREVASVVSVTLVNDVGVQAGTVDYAVSGSTLNLSNVNTTPGTAKLRIGGATDAAGYSTAVIDVPLTR